MSAEEPLLAALTVLFALTVLSFTVVLPFAVLPFAEELVLLALTVLTFTVVLPFAVLLFAVLSFSETESSCGWNTESSPTSFALAWELLAF